MRQLRSFAAVVFGICLAASFGAAADDTDGPTFDEIRKQQLELREEVAGREGIFQAMEDVDRTSIMVRQDELLTLIEGKEAVQDLDDESQVRAFNLLQEINAIVNNVEDDRVVCEYVRKTGSHRKSKQCYTVAERREQRAAAQRNMQETLERFCVGAACS